MEFLFGSKQLWASLYWIRNYNPILIADYFAYASAPHPAEGRGAMTGCV